MATTVAALKGRLGSTDYFVLAMKAQELVNTVHIPSEIDGWDNLTIEEIYQRDINYSRVKNQIAPYLASDPDRFFGSIIVAAENLTPDQFEPLPEVATTGLPRVYRAKSSGIGFLTFDGNERMFPLDGQHRLKAIAFALRGTDESGKKIESIRMPDKNLADENVAVIVVPFEPKKARKIFTKVNRYAKQTATGEHLVTDDDDLIAILSREISNLIGGRLVKYSGPNSLSPRDVYFTTLSNLEKCNIEIMSAHFPKIDRMRLPDDAKVNQYKSKVKEEWDFLLRNIDLFRSMLKDRTERGDDRRRQLRKDYILGKPIPQKCLVTAYIDLTQRRKIDPKKAAENLNRIPWEQDDYRWDGLLFRGKKLLYKNAKLASKIISYWAGAKLSEEEIAALENQYKKLFPDDVQESMSLPKPIASSD